MPAQARLLPRSPHAIPHFRGSANGHESYCARRSRWRPAPTPIPTNVLASSIATRALCSELLESIIHDHELLTCQPVLRELEGVLIEKLRLPEAVVAGFLALVKAEGTVVESRKNPSIPIKDADDIAILACAIAGKADVFVTGDNCSIFGKLRTSPSFRRGNCGIDLQALNRRSGRGNPTAIQHSQTQPAPSPWKS
jgi:uncharacterized protein